MGVQTYTLIDQQVLTGSTASVTFSSIPQTFEDLVLEITGSASSAVENAVVQINGDSGTNYSTTVLRGNGTAASSTRYSSATSIKLDLFPSGVTATFENVFQVQFMSYTNANVNKTVLGRFSNASQAAGAIVGLWRSTSAVSSFSVSIPTTTWATGSTFRLYGLVS